MLTDSMLTTLPAFLSISGAAIMAGVFFAFSNFVMKALEALPQRSAILAMQWINVTVLNRGFLGIFVGTAVLCSWSAVATVLQAPAGTVSLSAYLSIAGACCYLAGTFFVTARFNVPLNKTLECVDPGAESSRQQWQSYMREWLRWNHVRTVTSLLAAMLMICSLLTGENQGKLEPPAYAQLSWQGSGKTNIPWIMSLR
ncbi:MAG: DUF1772 domain-containing protein [Pseudomonadales bacterium]|nr:DUF1772 domain-containing protein [Pseudomonadales bacterium]